jgi:heavy metal translocating P-type ATPase
VVNPPVNCALCGLPTAHPIHDAAGAAFCCPACREVSALLEIDGRTGSVGDRPEPETGQSRIDRATAEPNATRNTQYATTVLSLGGMWCASCSWLIGETLERAPGVQSAEISFVQRQARVTFDPGRTSLRQLTRRVRGLGYRAWGPDEKPYDEEDALWTRLLICGVLVLHEMLASFVIYGRDWLGISSADTEWLVNFFNWMGLLVAVPVILLLGLPVIRAGAASLARGRPNIHTLIALGAVAAFALSMRNLLAGSGRVYFETTSVLLFLVGIGHWLELRAQKTGTAAVDQLFQQIPAEASVVTAAGEARLPVAQLMPGMRVRVRPGEHFPADGLIAEGRGDVDESLLTGEPDPLLRTPGERVLAGTANLDGAFDVITTAVGAATMAGQIGKLLHGALWQRAPIERLADRLAAWMVPAAVILGLATFAFWSWQAGLETGLVNALAVLLIACPCALGIATPLTLWVGLGRAAEAGIILRSTAALEGLAAVQHAFFDKTGTLTRQPIRLQAVNTNGSTPSDFLACVAAVESLSEHPLARAIVAGVREQETPPNLQPSTFNLQPPPANFRALPGRGVMAEVDGKLIAVGSRGLMAEQGLALPDELAEQAAGWQAAGLSVVYAGWAGRVRGVLGLGEEVRPEVATTLRELAGLQIGVTVLTGDDAAAGRRWQQSLSVPVRAEQRPEDKLAALTAAGAGVLMVGDGINDGPALAAATVGIGLVNGADVAQSASEVILLHDDLRAIPWLIALARQALGKVRQNLAWAFVYNLAGLALAVTGHMQPAIAALLMVANSALVTWNGLRLRGTKFAGAYAEALEQRLAADD